MCLMTFRIFKKNEDRKPSAGTTGNGGGSGPGCTKVLPSPAKATTKHPRHRPGSSCVVCSQAPTVSQKKPTSQPPADSAMKQAELGGASSNHQILKPAQQPACILKPPIPILQTKKPTEDHQTSKTASASLPAGKPERRLLDLNHLPESDDEDSMQ
ncbi:hypothetical protein L6452_31843 [Arctium lappa]|uniref:Uncharacterized protein n=1 Tax=Arctium lappa TaxID=4217 RepID=A0ACB8Z3T6_ARCLA|nr:hypothetical protein L6452_31843 [Arctium lappa]